MQTVINILGVILSLLTATGVFIHDARIDRATQAISAVSVKKAASKITFSDLGLVGGDHTHPEHNARTLKGFTYKTPSFPPREMRIKRYMMQNIEPRGRHAFDNYHLPFLDDETISHKTTTPTRQAHALTLQRAPSLARVAGAFLLLGVVVP